MAWVLIAAIAWFVLAVVVALVVARAVHVADEQFPPWLDDDRLPRDERPGASHLTVLPGPRQPTDGRPSGSPAL